MREIKFRAWNSIDNQYIDWMTICGMPKLITNIARGKEKYYFLEQYSGVKDKFNSEIYEGDIVHFECDDVDNFFMVSISESGCFIAHDHINHADCYFLDDLDYKVVGNVRENPEIMERK